MRQRNLWNIDSGFHFFIVQSVISSVYCSKGVLYGEEEVLQHDFACCCE